MIEKEICKLLSSNSCKQRTMIFLQR